ncbi:hypothetical protein RFI_08080, partial [Reticulomyxa filosa]
MAFEVFDDVAFYWFGQVLLGIFLIPLTIKKVRSLFGQKKRTVRTHPVVKNIPDYIPTQKLVEDETENRFSLSNIFFLALWGFKEVSNSKITINNNNNKGSLFECRDIRTCINFNPVLKTPSNLQWVDTSYNKRIKQQQNPPPFFFFFEKKFETLSEPHRSHKRTGATLDVIKRAYYKQSLIYHPDVNKSPDAAEKFILITKAYETLTNEETREKYEKYGNPDGYQGTHVTIGLPAILTRKENELIILVVYFAVLILLVGIAWFWWKQTDKFHKSGF